jgi:hypothetical protein
MVFPMTLFNKTFGIIFSMEINGDNVQLVNPDQVPEGVSVGGPEGVPKGDPVGVPEEIQEGVPVGVSLENTFSRPRRSTLGTYKVSPVNIRKIPIEGEV